MQFLFIAFSYVLEMVEQMFSVWDTFSWWCLFWNKGLTNNYQQGCDCALQRTNLKPTIICMWLTPSHLDFVCVFAAVVLEFKQLDVCGTAFESFCGLKPGLRVTELCYFWCVIKNICFPWKFSWSSFRTVFSDQQWRWLGLSSSSRL